MIMATAGLSYTPAASGRAHGRVAKFVMRKFIGVIAIAIGGVVAGAFFAGSAFAQDTGSSEAIRVALRNQVDEGGDTSRVPVPGVSVTVTDASGAEVGTGVTGDDGFAVIPLPGEGQYTVELDESTFPDDVALLGEIREESVSFVGDWAYLSGHGCLSAAGAAGRRCPDHHRP